MQSQMKSDVVVLFHGCNLITPWITPIWLNSPDNSCKLRSYIPSPVLLFPVFPVVLDDGFPGFRIQGRLGLDRLYESFVIMMQGYDAPMLYDLIYIRRQSIWQYIPASRWSVPYLEFPKLLRQVRFRRNFTLQLNILHEIIIVTTVYILSGSFINSVIIFPQSTFMWSISSQISFSFEYISKFSFRRDTNLPCQL